MPLGCGFFNHRSRWLPRGWGLCFVEGIGLIGKFGQRLRRTPTPRMVKQCRAADKALVALALLHVVGPIVKFGQRLRRTPAPRMVKQCRAANRFLVAFASEVFGGQFGGVVLVGNRRDLVERHVVGTGGGPQHSIEFERACWGKAPLEGKGLCRAIKVCWDFVLT
jgi:hypothetical protein